ADVDWNGLAAGRRRTPVPAPTQVFQRRRFWFGDDLPQGDDRRTTAWHASVRAASRQAAHGPLDISLGNYKRAWRALERLAAVLGQNALVTLGAFPAPGVAVTLGSVLEATGIRPMYSDVVRRCLESLAESGDLVRTGDGYRVVAQPLDVVDAAPHW